MEQIKIGIFNDIFLIQHFSFVFQNIFWNQKHVVNQDKHEKKIVLSHDNKELFEKSFVKVSEQSWKHMEA